MFNVESASNTTAAQTIFYIAVLFSYLLGMMNTVIFAFALASANVWASPEKAEKCEGCKYEEAAVVAVKGNVVFKGALPEVVLREIRTVPAVESDIVDHTVDNVAKYFAAEHAFGKLVDIKRVPVRIFNHRHEEVFNNVDTSDIIGVATNGQLVASENSQWVFEFGESPAKHSLLVLDFPNVGIELSGSGSSTIIDVSKRFASEFLLKREKLIVPQAPEPNTDFQWKTMVLDNSSPLQPKIVKQQEGFVLSALDPIYEHTKLTPVYVQHPDNVFWGKFDQKTREVKEKARNLQINSGLTSFEKRIIAKDYAEELIPKHRLENALVSVERFILMLELLHPFMSRLNLYGASRASAAKIFVNEYICPLAHVSADMCIINGENLREDVVASFLVKNIEKIHSVAEKEERARREAAEVESWEAVFTIQKHPEGKVHVALRRRPEANADFRRPEKKADVFLHRPAERDQSIQRAYFEREQARREFVVQQQAIWDDIKYRNFIDEQMEIMNNIMERRDVDFVLDGDRFIPRQNIDIPSPQLLRHFQ